MKIFIVTHGKYDENHISLCTTDFELSLKHFIDYAKSDTSNSMEDIEIWEDNKKIFRYYVGRRYDEVKFEVTFEELKEDFLKKMLEVFIE